MSEARAIRALGIALAAPAPTIKIEFQGGAPLLDFPLIQQVVEAARRDAPGGKKLDFVIASNLALPTDEVLAFCRVCESAWNKNPVSGATGIQSGPPGW